MSESTQRMTVQLGLLVGGLAALAMLGSPWFNFDDSSRNQIISLLGALAAAAGGASNVLTKPAVVSPPTEQPRTPDQGPPV